MQADPIRAPARAQDLILRHRVAGYRAGDLERRFGSLGLEEDFLYAYGFMPRETYRLLHPRAVTDTWRVPDEMAARVLAFVREHGPTHPADLAQQFGRERAVNGWGGFSQATTRALQSLHYHGLLRVSGRRDGIRVYEAAAPHPEPLPPDDRMRRIVRLVVDILAPVADLGLASTFGLLGRGAPGLGEWREALAALLASGGIGERRGRSASATIGRRAARAGAAIHKPCGCSRPFDPIVWERRRFEHLWGWDYRFEAYTRPEQRRFGYYAMPLLWGYEVIGWANVSMAGDRLDVKLGFVKQRPSDPAFRRSLEAELAGMELFLAGVRRKI